MPHSLVPVRSSGLKSGGGNTRTLPWGGCHGWKETRVLAGGCCSPVLPSREPPGNFPESHSGTDANQESTVILPTLGILEHSLTILSFALGLWSLSFFMFIIYFDRDRERGRV